VNVVRLIIGGLVALFALVATLLAACVVALATIFGLLARALGIKPSPRRPAQPPRATPGVTPGVTPTSPHPGRHAPRGAADEVIDVVVTEVTSSPPPPKS
jgi:hypothetical protein